MLTAPVAVSDTTIDSLTPLLLPTTPDAVIAAVTACETAPMRLTSPAADGVTTIASVAAEDRATTPAAVIDAVGESVDALARPDTTLPVAEGEAVTEREAPVDRATNPDALVVLVTAREAPWE